MHHARAPKLIALTGAELLTLAEAKLHLRVDASDSDTEIAAMVIHARQFAEDYTGLSLTARTLEIALDAFPNDDDSITLPGGPVSSITSVTVSGVAIDSALYVLDDYSTVSRVYQVSGWPVIAEQTNKVKVRYAAGYAAGACPGAIVAAVKLVLGHLFENRQAAGPVQIHELPLAIESLLRPHRVRLGMA